MIRSYKDLIVWQKAFKLALAVYEVTKKFPKEEQYGLVSQMRRSAISIPSNIAEGYARHRRLEYIQFLQIAFASGAELETQPLIARGIGLVKEKDFATLSTQLDEVMKMLNSLIDKLKRYKTNA
jgi:four helix bundle protein